jgi:polyvinyl alcohol dehydrogenase (cytochrome)
VKGLDGQVYAQPLIAGGRIYVATENNTVYAFTLGGRKLWQRHLGQPVAGSELPCGNIDPSGITSAPVIADGKIYVVAFLHGGLRHTLFGLRLSNGHTAVRTNVDPPNRQVEQQRGALLATGGRIYIPYGGLLGDCGPYHGFVISTTTDGRHRISYKNPAPEAGIWAPAGISQQTGALLVATGNGGGNGFGSSNSVIRLSLGLKRQAYWAPRDWKALSAGDVDEGSLAPLPISGGRVFQIGKDGVGYLLGNRLGGIGGELFAQRVCNGGAFGAAAFRAPFVVLQCGGGNYALRLDGDRFSVAWHNSAGGMVPVIAGDSAFAITRSGTLVQMRMSNGSVVAGTNVGAGATSFPQPAVAGNTLVAPAGRGVAVFSI